MKLYLFYVFIVIFAAGLIVGYFVERTGIIYTQSEIEKLRQDIENMQIQEMFISVESVDCNLLFSTMGKLSYDLYDLVNRLRSESPITNEFTQIKTQADFLSLRAWILARDIREQCTEDVLPVLFMYSELCEECVMQDSVLQELKQEQEHVLVYSIDIGFDQPAIRLVKDAYGVESTPSMIIDHKLYGKTDREQLEQIICSKIRCN